MPDTTSGRESGLHASLHPFDALRYAPGNIAFLRTAMTEEHVSDLLDAIATCLMARFERDAAKEKARALAYPWDYGLESMRFAYEDRISAADAHLAPLLERLIDTLGQSLIGKVTK